MAMTRWGLRLFEGSRDLDLALSIDKTFVTDENPNGLGLFHLVNQHDLNAPLVALLHYQTAEHQEAIAKYVVEIRTKLDTGLGKRLINYWRAKESEYNGKYRVIIVGALLMRTGAKIQESDMQHLRELVPQVSCNYITSSVPESDRGFREPGRAQFLAALENYKPGEPRNFEEPSCWQCGKVQADIGKALRSCGRCKHPWYCDKECQKAHWKIHKPACQAHPKIQTLVEEIFGASA
ncbi:uncharacterized protein F4812DRAFT_447264 [Daldinia caldariorum]|uniref:uncharacterized protein n=1 Tax=Daldinia caldariorum TaxID=326644 RepID=UPI0020085686|nr:uncharacterized protein F4812DRAFT_447264 [Daldinia caldariorum]KAI1463297.1 hypothetical protein F4812DRAFT_447264 [Daldinia caldariorum]